MIRPNPADPCAHVAGVDEAGRGPLAGPVVVAAVILDPRRHIRGLADSKIENVVLENCTFKNAEKPSVFENVGTVTLRNFRLLPKEGIDRN